MFTTREHGTYFERVIGDASTIWLLTEMEIPGFYPLAVGKTSFNPVKNVFEDIKDEIGISR